jgi:hypothetical protein
MIDTVAKLFQEAMTEAVNEERRRWTEMLRQEAVDYESYGTERFTGQEVAYELRNMTDGMNKEKHP